MGVTEMTKNRQYDMEYKVQALKLAHEIGGQRAAEKLEFQKTPCMGGCTKSGRAPSTLVQAAGAQTML